MRLKFSKFKINKNLHPNGNLRFRVITISWPSFSVIVIVSFQNLFFMFSVRMWVSGGGGGTGVLCALGILSVIYSFALVFDLCHETCLSLLRFRVIYENDETSRFK